MKKAYSYVRFSSQKQAEGRSQSRQSEACEKFCTANGLDLAKGEEYTFLDAGKSGYKAEHLDDNGQLRRFLSLVENGTIAQGSYLIVESLDRLSREHVKIALSRFLELLGKGINIVTLLDDKTYTNDCTELDLILSILIMKRAHEESATKSKRVGDAWHKKKEKARTENKPIGDNAPLWIDYSKDGGYSINEPRADIIRRIFDLTINGRGKVVICKALNDESIKAFKPPTNKRKTQTWGTSSIQKILSNRALLGEYQPYTGRGRDRKPSGAPIPNYYPIVISEAIFYQAQEAIEGRLVAGATKQTPHFNVWQGVARCGICQGPLHLVNKGTSPKGGTYLHCYAARKGLCKAKAIRLDQTEIVFKEILSKLDSLSLVQASSASLSKQLSEIEGRLAEQKGKLGQHEASMREYPSSLLARLARECEQIITSLSKEKEVLSLALASETITDKEDFIAKLGLVLVSYEDRYLANALLKRLKITVLIDRVDDTRAAKYMVLADGKYIRGILQDADNTINNSVAFTPDQLKKGKVQDFDGTVESGILMLASERDTEFMSGKLWNDATLENKIVEMLARTDMPIAKDDSRIQDVKDYLDSEFAKVTDRMEQTHSAGQRWLDSLDA